MINYLVATIKAWNIDAFKTHTPNLPGEWHLITNPDDLTVSLIEKIRPRYIFFPHWSWIVPSKILDLAECVCFHMSDVPYGRGGSPLQNLITQGHKSSKLTALRMVEGLDAGPVYLKKPLSLEGRAQDILVFSANLVYEMIADIVEKEPGPVPQYGEVVTFKRRTPDMSRLPENTTSVKLFDHIRMLDADTYPKAFIDYGNYRLTFSNATLKDDNTVSATVLIENKDKDS